MAICFGLLQPFQTIWLYALKSTKTATGSQKQFFETLSPWPSNPCFFFPFFFRFSDFSCSFGVLPLFPRILGVLRRQKKNLVFFVPCFPCFFSKKKRLERHDRPVAKILSPVARQAPTKGGGEQCLQEGESPAKIANRGGGLIFWT